MSKRNRSEIYSDSDNDNDDHLVHFDSDQDEPQEPTNPTPPPSPPKPPIYPTKKTPPRKIDIDDPWLDIDDFDDNIFTILFNKPFKPNRNNKVITDVPKKEDISDTCKNPLCNHLTYEEDSTLVQIPDINEITNISHLIELGKSYHCKKNLEYRGVNLRVLCNLVVPLTELNGMIGMQNVKEKMVDQILFFLQGYHTTTTCKKCVDCVYNLPCTKNQNDMLHTVITGPPGVGKTELGKILGRLYKEMGILSNEKFKVVGRADLVAGYLGQTAMKTQKVIDECKGGVLFIDEAYALGHEELRDSFSKECIDTLNQNLSEKRDFLCIIAGYKDALENCFFKFNDGLRRRFTFRYDLIPYKYDELQNIFELKVRFGGFKLCYTVCDTDTPDDIEKKQNYEKQIKTLFNTNYHYFPNNGGDVETLFLNCKIAHSRAMVGKRVDEKYELSVSDISRGFKAFRSSRDYKGINKKQKLNDVGTSFYS